MKICYIVDSSEEKKMGLFYAVHNRIKKFQEHNHNIEVYSIRKYHSSLLRFIRTLFKVEVKKRGKKEFVYDSIVYHNIWYCETLISYILEKLSYPDLFYLLYVKGFVKNRKKDSPDLIIAHWGLECGLFAMQLSKLLNKPFAVCYHVSDIHSSPLCWKKTLKRVMKQASANIFVSRYLLGIARTFYQINNSYIVCNGFDPTIFYQRTLEEKKQIRENLKISGKIVAFYGNLEIVKRADLLPFIFSEIIKKVENDSCWIVGDGSLRKQIEIECNDNLLNVTFWGRVSAMKVAELMNVSDVLILPSKKEGYPLVLLEALACGTVCVSNSVGGIPEILSDSYLVDDQKLNWKELFVQKVCDVLYGRVNVVESKTFNTWEDVYQQEYVLFNKIIRNEDLNCYSCL